MSVVIESDEIGRLELKDGVLEGKTLEDVSDMYGLEMDGCVFIVNGVRLSAAQTEEYRIKAGDVVQHQPKGEGGTR